MPQVMPVEIPVETPLPIRDTRLCQERFPGRPKRLKTTAVVITKWMTHGMNVEAGMLSKTREFRPVFDLLEELKIPWA